LLSPSIFPLTVEQVPPIRLADRIGFDRGRL
jgi:hypothetical protein